MSCDHVIAVLSGESPPVDVDDHLASCDDCRALARQLDGVDILARHLPELEPPGELVAATLAAMEAEIAAPATPTRRGLKTGHRTARLWWGGGVALAAAATALLAAWPDPPHDTSEMVERGFGDRVPDVALKVAVDHEGHIARLSRDRAYSPGDTLYFRAQVDSDAWLGLVRVDPAGAHLLHQQTLAAGEADLALRGGPLAWRIEQGEDDAVFALISAPEALPAQQVEAALAGAYDPSDPARSCLAAQDLGARCSAATVRVLP